MQFTYLRAISKIAVRAVTVVLLGVSVCFAQSTVNLTAAPASAVLPDGQVVPMWGYRCTGTPVAATCAALNPNAGTNWSPVVITVSPGDLTINLTNSLSFPLTPNGSNSVPTSLVIVGQLGGGLGTTATHAPSPTHAVQGTTWPIVGDSSGATFNPPPQGPRVQSFATEVAVGSSSALTWKSLKLGTYLIESGTHPSIQGPMGLYGVLVVTTAPQGTTRGIAYSTPLVNYDAEIPLELSEIDAAQNAAVAAAVTTTGFSETSARILRDSVSSVSVALDAAGNPIGGGGYHIGDAVTFSGGGPSVGATAQVASVDSSGGITSVTLTTPGTGYSSVPSVSVTSTGSGANLVAALSLAGVMCSDGAAACYPPAVNYDPRYYLINGVALDRTNLLKSLFATTPSTVTGTVLVRFVNAGLRMHVPSIVGALTGSPTTAGFSLIAEDGNPLPGIPRVQSEVFLAAGKTYDVLINAPVNAARALPLFDRQLSLSTNNQRDGGMQAYIGTNGATVAPSVGPSAVANPDSYFWVPGNTLTVADPAKGVIANDVGIYGVAVYGTGPASGTLALNSDGTFTYRSTGNPASDSFVYCGNGDTTGAAPRCNTVTLTNCAKASGCTGAAPTATDDSYTSNIAARLQVAPPGVLGNDSDPQGHPLTASVATNVAGGTVTLNPNGSFTAVPTTPPTGTATARVIFQYTAVNSQKTASASPATVTVTFNGGSGLQVKVWDAPSTLPGSTPVAISDYRWIVEEDRTFQIDPACQVNSGTRPANCPPLPTPSLGTNFHTSYMPVVAAGCVGTVACESGQTVFDPSSRSHLPAVCDIGNGACRTDAAQQVPVDPSLVHLDPNKRYYISILPGDAGNSFSAGAGAPVNSRPFSIAQDCPSGPGGADFVPGTGTCGHGMGGARIAPAQTSVDVKLEETPLQPTKIAVFVFEDDNPLNGENDAGGGVDNLATNEPGLGGFSITLFDDAGGTGDATGQMTYDMFNMPLSNSLAGTTDPAHPGNDACPITKSKDGLIGMIVTCPHFESDGKTVSPLEGQAVIANMMPGRYGVMATPGADRIARGEEWLQTNTLDGQKAHDAFIKVGGPAYFQEFGPGGYHDVIGFANPKIINGRLPQVCAKTTCSNSVKGKVTTARTSRTPDQRLYSSGSRDALGFTQCYVSLGDPDGADIAFTKCAQDGTFGFSGIPDGSWRLTIFDQWNDQIVDGLSTPVALGPGNRNVDMGDIPVQQWHTNIYTRTFFDDGDGVSNLDGQGNPTEPGLTLLPTNIRFRDGSYSNFNNTDLNGFAGFNEIFPLFNWYVIEADTTRYKQTGVHVVYDAGGPADGTSGGGTSTIASNFANTIETNHLPTNLRVPGAVYCDNADCAGFSIKNGPASSAANPSTGRIDPPSVTTEAWQGFIGQNEFIEFGKKPFAAGENGGIHGEVIYASTRPFDDPALLIHTSWTPDVPGVTVNLYQETTASDGTQSLKLVDTTKTSSWDDWAQGFHLGADGKTMIPDMNCPGQDPTSPFYFTLENSTQWLNPDTPLPSNSQFKCYDGFAMFNQVQPAPYDGMYQFPSVTSTDPTTGLQTGTNCTICINNPTGDGTKMLPAGMYVVEMIVPPGYELVKEEDKNILIGDNYIAPVTQQFAGLGSIFILPDQAEVSSAYNPNNPQNPTEVLGRSTLPSHEGDTGSVETFWPCVGQTRVVPDYISLFPLSKEVSPFAGATRNLCDRKEVMLDDQTAALAKFWIFSSTHVAAHFTGIVLDDFSSEFDPFSPQYGEKFAVPNVPVSFKDHMGVEIARTYSDQWGLFNGLQYSTWEVNPPNPTGYAPTMMVTCMNDPGPIPDPAHPGQTMMDPLYNPSYSQFCYEIPFMPGQTQYMDTPVVPVSGFAEGYNLPDCSYPDTTPAVASVLGDLSGGGSGPWVSAPTSSSGMDHLLTINALGDQIVPNHAYSGPSASKAPFNQKFITRHYGFGNTQGSGSVTIGGVNATVNSWSDKKIVVRVPANVPLCTIQQNGAGNSGASCGELVITADNGKKSIDTVTVTISGKPPIYINGENASNNAIQGAIDSATPGDLIMVGPGTYNEMLLMWKPVRLQGIAAASVVVNANTHPSGRIDPWRRQVACLFGLSLNGGAISPMNRYDPNGTYQCDRTMQGQVDPIPLEPLVGWDPTLNGNIAELLQEPTLMGAYEGAGITVLAKGMENAAAVAGGGAAPIPLNNTTDCSYVSNFLCNPARVDGMTFANSSQGGGGIFLHGWNHFTEVSNNRVHANAGTLTGGITIGQAETPDGIITGTQQLAFGYNTNVNVHNNSVTQNAAYGDELNSTTPMGAGGVTFCTGSDSYKFNFNWVCGNLSTGDGGGFAHFGFSYNGNISNNWFLFNQSTNPTIPTHGGGVLVMGAPPDGLVCENIAVDIDCPPSLSDGIGPGLVIDSNLIIGNTAESGSGGGLRLQNINGTEVGRNPNTPGNWYGVAVTNNIIANNVAGWDGGGVSLQDALRVSFINNTVVSNDTTASAGVLFNTLGAPNANTPPPGCDPTVDPSCANSQVTQSSPLPAGLVTMPNTPNLVASLPTAGITCAPGQPQCARFSNPLLGNNLFWQNRTFHIQVGGLGTGPLSQQNLVTLLPQLTQPQANATSANGAGLLITGGTGACVPAPGGNNYWDIGVRGDTGPSNHSSGLTLIPIYSILTDAADYPNANNLGSNPDVASQYCNGSRVPPENGGLGYEVPPGISDATLPNPLFNLTPSATVDEGNNWVNMTFGPLSLTNPSGTTLGDYSITAGSPAIDAVPVGAPSYSVAPSHDFFGNPRPDHAGAPIDIGAVEIKAKPAPTVTTVLPGSGSLGGGTAVTITGSGFLSGATVKLGGTTASTVTVVNSTSITATTPAHAAGAVNVVVTNTDNQSGTLTNGYTYGNPAPTVTAISPGSGSVSGGTAVTITGNGFLSGATVKLGGTAASTVTVVNSTSITATTPAHAAGAVNVVVTNTDNQSGTLTSGFTYTSSTITFVQVKAATPQTASASVAVTYAVAQTAGNLNVVVVGWNDTTSTVSAVTDSRGNSYALAVGPTTGTGLRQSIYYAKNIAAGSNTVTVTFNKAAAFVDIRALEYSGVNSLDVTSASTGNSTTSSSGSATTTAANELIFGANTVFTQTQGAGGGFTSRIITPFGDIAEDRIVSSTGSYSATAPLKSAGNWVMQMVTFKNSTGGNLPPTVSLVSPSSGSASGATAVTITGSGFLSGATVKLGGTAASTVTVVNSTSITATTPAHVAGAVNVVVTNADNQSGTLTNGYTYGNPAPTVTAISPGSGSFSGGTAVTITGSGFLSGATVKLGGTTASTVTVVNSTSITATTPAHAAGAVNVVVTNTDNQSGTLTNGYTYGNPAPTVTAISPGSGSVSGGTAVTITGNGFLSGATVKLGGTAASTVTVVNSTSITATTPAHAAGAVNVVVTNTDNQSGTLTSGFTYTSSTITFVQVKAATPQTASASVAVTYAVAQTAGNLNVVVVGWNDTTSTVSAVTDSRGNSYALAVGPTTGTGLRQSIYYAKNIAAGSNTVTVTFNKAAAFVDIRALEYSGLDTANPLDKTAGAAGSGTSASSGSAVTSSANELIFGAGMTTTHFTAAGTGFTSRIITSPDADIAEDQTVSSAGSYSATAPVTSSSWVMQMATFK